MSRLTPTYLATPITDLIGHFNGLDRDLGITPTTFAASLAATWRKVTDATADLHLATVGDLLDNMSQVIAHASGGEALSAFATLALRDARHLTRNTAMAVLLAAALHTHDPSDLVLQHAPALQQRTQGRERPLTDDEIVLLRVLTLSQAAVPAQQQRAATYALCDAGQTLAETTAVTPAHVDLVDMTVDSCGNRHTAPRPLDLSPIHARLLTPRLQPSTGRPVVYTGKADPGSNAASASTSASIKRLMLEAKIKHDDVTPGGIRTWRIRHTYLTQGLAAAATTAGATVRATLRLAHIDLSSQTSTAPIERF